MATRRRGRIPAGQLERVEAFADDLLHYASGSGWTERGVNVICRALGWPKIGHFQGGVKWASPARNFAECVEGGAEYWMLERLRGAGLAEVSALHSGGRREYRITQKGQAVAYLRHIAVREAAKAVG